MRALLLPLVALLTLGSPGTRAQEPSPDSWRTARRLIDLHVHVGMRPTFLDRAVRIMDTAGIGVAVNLSGGTVTSKADAPSGFERNLKLVRKRHPDRFVHYMNLDYAGWDEPDFSKRAVRQIEQGRRLGAAGLKEYKRLGASGQPPR